MSQKQLGTVMVQLTQTHANSSTGVERPNSWSLYQEHEAAVSIGIPVLSSHYITIFQQHIYTYLHTTNDAMIICLRIFINILYSCCHISKFHCCLKPLRRVGVLTWKLVILRNKPYQT